MASSRDQQASRLQARAERLERDLAAVILELDDDAVTRLAHAALELGFTDEEVRALFARSISTHLETAFDLFGNDTADEYGLPRAPAAVQDEAQIAISEALDDLSAEARKVITRLVGQAQADGISVGQLANQIRDQVVLTERQNGWVDNFEHKLRTDKRRALRNKLRDRRSDRSLLRDEPLTESQIASQTGRYRDRMIRHRALNIARHELLKASNGSHMATWENAEKQGVLAKGVRKFWWHMHDRKVRTSHREIPGLNPGGVAIADSFVTPLGRLRYPLDPLGAREDVIGCRCLVLFDTANPEGAT